MKTLFTTFSLLFIAYLPMRAQGLIAVQNGGQSTFYTLLGDAVANATDGDTIYLPGGSFSFNAPIDKELHIVGVGYHPDSTAVTGMTIITGGMEILSSAEGGSVTGIHFIWYYSPGYISFSGDINGYSVLRCNINGGIATNPNNSSGDVRNILIEENIIYSYNPCSWCSGSISISLSANNSSILQNNLITNNIIHGTVNVTKSVVKNNIFLYQSQYYQYQPLSVDNCIVENNFFVGLGNYSARNSLFRNNVNCSISDVDGFGNQGIGNISGGSYESIFVNYPGGGGLFSSNPPDFHLPFNSPFHNAGTDGSDIGIYGGPFPWKDGGIPFNPHIQSKNIPDTTNPNGNLQINIRVKAQGN